MDEKEANTTALLRIFFMIDLSTVEIFYIFIFVFLYFISHLFAFF